MPAPPALPNCPAPRLVPRTGTSLELMAGAFGNRRPVMLLPQPGVFMPAAGPGLIRARHHGDPGMRARGAKGMKAVQHHHLLPPRPALILAEDVMLECVCPGAMAVTAPGHRDRVAPIRAILRLLPKNQAQPAGLTALPRFMARAACRC